MSTNVYKLKWKHFNSNQNYSLNELFNKNENADVTLVTDDKVTFPAHKIVLSACSPILKELLINNLHPHPIIYLNEVKRFELNSLLEFVYLGKTQFHQSRMEKFLETARNLQIKQLSYQFINNDESRAKDASVLHETRSCDGEPIVVKNYSLTRGN